MANPQAENGYVRLANELMEALSRINLASYEWRVLICILRLTYGWQKKFDCISISRIAQITRLPRPHICRAKKSLLQKNLLIENNGLIGPNKNYDSWNVTNSGTVTNSGNESAKTSKKQRNIACTGTSAYSGNAVAYIGNKTLPVQAPQKKEYLCSNLLSCQLEAKKSLKWSSRSLTTGTRTPGGRSRSQAARAGSSRSAGNLIVHSARINVWLLSRP